MLKIDELIEGGLKLIESANFIETTNKFPDFFSDNNRFRITGVSRKNVDPWYEECKYYLAKFVSDESLKRQFEGYFLYLQYNDLEKVYLEEAVDTLQKIKKYELTSEKETIKIDTNDLKNKSDTKDMTKVFIVHGHDDSFKLGVARFIEKELGLEAIILHEQANEGKTIIEKLEAHTEVGYGIVLYSPCDKGCKNGDENNLQPRARQNVVLEHGFLMGKLGRNRVGAIVKSSDVEIPNDYSGVVYMHFYDNWQFKLVKELKAAGYNVSL